MQCWPHAQLRLYSHSCCGCYQTTHFYTWRLSVISPFTKMQMRCEICSPRSLYLYFKIYPKSPCVLLDEHLRTLGILVHIISLKYNMLDSWYSRLAVTMREGSVGHQGMWALPTPRTTLMTVGSNLGIRSFIFFYLV